MQFCASASTEASLAVLEEAVSQGDPGVEVLRMKDRLYTFVDISSDLAAGQVVSRLQEAADQVGYDPEAALIHA